MTETTRGDRNGFRYRGFTFSEDGRVAYGEGREYRQVEFSPDRRRPFKIGIALVILLILRSPVRSAPPAAV